MNQISARAALRPCPQERTEQVFVRSYGPNDIEPAKWEAFASRCGASHHCALEHIRFWQLSQRVRLFEIFRMEHGAPAKIGQGAVTLGLRSRRFLDSLQLLPGHDASWKPAMAAILRELGPGRYRYGSAWNLESCRYQDMQSLEALRIESAEPFAVQAVDFSNWADWDSYLHGVSNNARRNAKRSTQAHPDRTMPLHQRWAMLGKVRQLTRLRLAVCRRKGLEFQTMREWLRATIRAVIWRRYAFIACFEARAQTLAMFSGIHCGGNTYYLEGASREGNEGASWSLMLAMLQRGYERNPHGFFVMGIVSPDANLSRSRAQCRVSDHPTSIIKFHYAGPKAVAGESVSRPG